MQILQPSTRTYLKALLSLARARMTTVSAVTHFTVSVGAGTFSASLFFHSWIFILLTQFTTHFLGEVYDYPSDRLNSHASRFTGGSKVLVYGKITIRHALHMALLTGSLAIFTIFTLPNSRVLATLIFVLATQYSAPPFLLNHRALGELDATFITSLLVPLFSFSIQTALPLSSIFSNPLMYYLILPPFFTKFSLFLILNLADRRPDWAGGKITLAVLLGDRNTARAYRLCMYIAYSSTLITSAVCVYIRSPHAFVLPFVLPYFYLGMGITSELEKFQYRLEGVLPKAILHSTLLVWGVLLYLFAASLPTRGVFNIETSLILFFAYLTFSPIIRSHYHSNRQPKAKNTKPHHHYHPHNSSSEDDIQPMCACDFPPELPKPIAQKAVDAQGRIRSCDITIIGGGIAGLTAAITLRQLGFTVCVLEKRSSDQLDHGADLALWPGAITVLRKLGVPSEFFDQHCFRLDRVQMCKMGAEVLKNINMTHVTGESGEGFVLVARQLLTNALQSLTQHQCGADVYYNCTVEGVEETADRVHVNYLDEHGTPHSVSSRIALGADGAHSVTRSHIHPGLKNHINYCGEVCYRGVLSLDTLSKQDAQLVLSLLPDTPSDHCMRINYGAGLRSSVGYIDATGKTIFWWVKVITATPPPPGKIPHCTWPEPLKTLHDITPSPNFYLHRVNDSRPLSCWSSPRVVLIGDAAHVVSPNMGQGACMAIEDAFMLSTWLYKYWEYDDGHLEAFYLYQGVRKPYAEMVRKEARKQLLLGQLTRPWAVKIRETLLRKIPASVLEGKLRANCFDVSTGIDLLQKAQDARR